MSWSSHPCPGSRRCSPPANGWERCATTCRPRLLIAVAMGMGEAMDLWLMSQEVDDDALPGLIGVADEHDQRSSRSLTGQVSVIRRAR